MSLTSRGTPWVARMSRGRFALFAILCVVGALFLEPPLEIAGATPDFVLILVVYGAIRAGALGGGVLGFVAGLFRDTLLLVHFGLYALGLTAIGYAVGKMRESLYLDAPAADLLLLAVDRTMANPNCGAPRSAHNDPNGWEGVRIFTMSDGSSDYPGAPFATITPEKMQYTDCGAHTITAWTGLADHPTNPRLIVYVASYPLRPGPTCGVGGTGDTTNPYDEDKVVNDPLHRQIQVLSVPLNNPANTTEVAQPEIVYPGDPDGIMDWTERGLTGLTVAV